MKPKQKNKTIRLLINGILLIALLLCGYKLVDILWLKPYQSNKSLEEIQNIYEQKEVTEITPSITPSLPKEATPTPEITPTPDIEEPEEVVPLLKFQDLLALNSDVKGWIQIEGTNINYPVVQSSSDDPEFYLNRNINKEEDSYGTIFLDMHTNIETPTKNLLLHGHNMSRSKTMFHHLMKYNDIEFLKENPLIQFDTIYHEDNWKVFAVFKTNGSSEKEPLFDYRKSIFTDDSDFLNFVHDIRIRSIYNMPVDIGADDQILLLSTCSYEVDDYRTVVAARKIRPDEKADINVEEIIKNPSPLYPGSWYRRYGGSAPKVHTFEEALEAGEITWYYNPLNTVKEVNNGIDFLK